MPNADQPEHVRLRGAANVVFAAHWATVKAGSAGSGLGSRRDSGDGAAPRGRKKLQHCKRRSAGGPELWFRESGHRKRLPEWSGWMVQLGRRAVRPAEPPRRIVAAIAVIYVRDAAGQLGRAAVYFAGVWMVLGIAPTLVAGYASPRHMYLASAGWAITSTAASEPTSFRARAIQSGSPTTTGRWETTASRAAYCSGRITWCYR